MLSRLLLHEKVRFHLYLPMLGGWTVGLGILILFPFLAQNGAATLGGLFFCVGPLAVAIALPWFVFVTRFFFLSSARRLPKQLARYGPAAEVAKRIDADLGDLSAAFVEGRAKWAPGSPQPDCLILTDQWLLRLCPSGSAVIHLSDLVAVWRRDVARSAPLVMGKIEHQIGCRAADGAEWLFESWTERRTAHVLQEILERKPELLTGYRGEWRDLVERGEEAARVELRARRERFDALPHEEQEQWLDEAFEMCHRYVYRQDRQLPDGR